MGVIDAAVDVSTGGAVVTDVFELDVRVFNAIEGEEERVKSSYSPARPSLLRGY